MQFSTIFTATLLAIAQAAPLQTSLLDLKSLNNLEAAINDQLKSSPIQIDAIKGLLQSLPIVGNGLLPNIGGSDINYIPRSRYWN
jgi:hypothetical protein